MVSGEGGAFHLPGPAPRGQNRIPQQREDSAPAASRGCFPAGQRSEGEGARRGLRGRFLGVGRCLSSRTRWGRPRGLSAPKFSGYVGRLNVGRGAGKGRSSLLRSSRHSSPWEPPQKRLILLLPRVRRCHAALPRDCLGSFGGRRGALLGHLGNVLLFFWVGKPGCLLLADVSRQRRQVLSFQEVKISDAGFRAARDHGVRNYVRY